MTNALQHRTDLPTDPNTGLIPPLRTVLDSQQLTKHRAFVAMEIEIMSKKVDRFGWERDRGTPVQDQIIREWIEALQDYPIGEIRAARAAALIANPNKMPNEGHIIAQILAARKVQVSRHKASLPPPPPPPAPSKHPDAAVRAALASRLMREIGFKRGAA